MRIVETFAIELTVEIPMPIEVNVTATPDGAGATLEVDTADLEQQTRLAVAAGFDWMTQQIKDVLDTPQEAIDDMARRIKLLAEERAQEVIAVTTAEDEDEGHGMPNDEGDK